jgi:hypothetical protein
MRIPCKRLTIRGQMIVVAALALGLAMIAPIIGPLFAPRPRIAVTNPTVSIGNIPRMTRGRQVWTVNNVGPGPLQMWLEDQTDCALAPCCFESASVVQADGRKGSVPGGRGGHIVVGPGGQATIAMSWSSRQMTGTVHSYLDFGTNDPKQPRLRLALRGRIGP